MTDTTQNETKARRALTPEEFARFLEALSMNSEEASRLYTQLHKRLVGFFRLRGVSDPGEAADETLDRAAIKIAYGAPVPDVGRFARGIARYVAKERLRAEQRDGAASAEFIDTLPDALDEQAEAYYELLKTCFEQLGEEERILLAAYCRILRGRERSEHRRRLAEKMKTTVVALRMRVTRLRGILSDCVRKHAGGELETI
jgi:plasmid stabilization system protein ParE